MALFTFLLREQTWDWCGGSCFYPFSLLNVGCKSERLYLAPTDIASCNFHPSCKWL